MSAYALAALAALACLAAALGCMIAWAFAMMIDGNRTEHHLVRAGGFIAAGMAFGLLVAPALSSL